MQDLHCIKLTKNIENKKTKKQLFNIFYACLFITKKNIIQIH